VQYSAVLTSTKLLTKRNLQKFHFVNPGFLTKYTVYFVQDLIFNKMVVVH
jgi:hypothetical protein